MGKRFLRIAARAAVGLGLLAVVGLVAWRVWMGPDPEQILAEIDDPPSPVLSPEEELASFRVSPGFRVEEVAAEPLLVDPVAMDWDDDGRLYAVEMRGFMPDIDGKGETSPVGRVVVLEDVDGDGRMDESHVFLDSLVLPRAIAVLPEGVLIGVPPDLWLCEVEGGDEPRCGRRTRLSHYAVGRHDPEHLENRLLAGVDGWIHNAKSGRRFQLQGDRLQVGRAAFGGQWGLAQDDEGLLFHNHNSAFLYGDLIPSHYPMRHPATASNPDKPGVGVPLSDGETVFGVRVKPGLNRAYLRGTLRPDGRQLAPTGVSGLALQRGDQYGPDYAGSVFVPEVAGGVVARFAVDRDGLSLSAEHRTDPDPDWGQREFLASSDERFRPVDARVGPDGCIWVIDMYRGVVQHANYVSPHLRDYAIANGLVSPGATGRIWRIVREDRPIVYEPPPLASRAEQLAALEHPNGWVRDRARRRLVYEGDLEAIGRLRRLEEFSPRARRHALWALAGLGALGPDTWRAGLADPDPAVRRAALRAGEPLLQGGADVGAVAVALLQDPDPGVRLQAVHSLGELPAASRPLAVLLDIGRNGDALLVQAVVSGLTGLEAEALSAELARSRGAGEAGTDADFAWLRSLVVARFLAARKARDLPGIRSLLEAADGKLPEWQARLVLDGIRDAQDRPGTERIELKEPHPIFAAGRAGAVAEGPLAAAVAAVRPHFTWPGDPQPGGARPLTAEEEALRQRGKALYTATCAACHGADGRGQAGLAPSLVGSPWVRDADGWIVRIVLQGLTGPVLVGETEWNATMPPHGGDPRFDDEAVAGLVTHLRRAWGHAEEPVDAAAVVRIRAETSERALPWTVRELLSLDVAHRLDVYTGIYEVPVIGMELEVLRQQTALGIGMKGGGKAELADLGNGRFLGEGVMVQFDLSEDGVVRSAVIHRDGRAIPVSKQD